MTVADLVFYDVPGRGDVSVKIERDDSREDAGRYCATAAHNHGVGHGATLLDALTATRRYLEKL